MSGWFDGYRTGFLAGFRAAYCLFRDKPGWEAARDEYLAIRQKRMGEAGG